MKNRGGCSNEKNTEIEKEMQGMNDDCKEMLQEIKSELSTSISLLNDLYYLRFGRENIIGDDIFKPYMDVIIFKIEKICSDISA